MGPPVDAAALDFHYATRTLWKIHLLIFHVPALRGVQLHFKTNSSLQPQVQPGQSSPTLASEHLHLTFGISTGLNYSEGSSPLVYMTEQIGAQSYPYP